MTLNKQLLLVSLLLLSIPWAGCQYLQEIDVSLRSGQEQTLRASTQVIAKALAQSPAVAKPAVESNPSAKADTSTTVFYCHPIDYLVDTDGYADSWPQIDWHVWSNSDGKRVSYRCAIHDNQLMLFFDIKNDEMIFNDPTVSLAGNGDRLVLVTGSGKDYIFTAVAPGKMTVRYYKTPSITYRESRIDASLIDNANSYQLEISMPFQLTKGQLSFYIIDESSVDEPSADEIRYGPYINNSPIPNLIYQPDNLKTLLNTYTQAGQRLRLLNPAGWLIASTGSPEPATRSDSHWLLQKLYRGLLADHYRQQPAYSEGVNFSQRQEFKQAKDGANASLWYNDSLRAKHHILANAAPVLVNGQLAAILIAEQSSEQTATLTDQAFNRLFSLSIVIMGGSTLALLGYASWLSWRIRQLSKATQLALDEQGNICNHYPDSKASDEIGVLTRNYSELMKRIGDYTDYLQTLSRKLSHELRTPLAIIHSSLDNLEAQALDQPSRTYQQRAKEGALRLGKILTAMSEAKRVEESIEHSELEPIDMIALLTQLTAAYKDLYQSHHIQFENRYASTTLMVNAVPDLVVQMLDKLIDNAVSFCPADGAIMISLKQQKHKLVIAVSNDGPPLPEAMQNHLFDNMVSLRDESKGDTAHLGLGLYIVSLIVNFHDGAIMANNRADNSGVIFSITLPMA